MRYQMFNLRKSVAQHSLGATYAELWKVVCPRDGILAPRAISMRIAVDLVIRVETAAEAEAVQGGLKELNKACPLPAKGTLSPVREAHVKLTASIARVQVKLCRVDATSDLDPRIVTCSRERDSNDETARHPVRAEIARTLRSTKRLRVRLCVRYQLARRRE